MTVEPLGARILVRPLEQEDKTAGGIIVPDVAKETPQQGIVQAVGSDDEMMTDLAEGDRVLYAKYTGNELSVDGVDYLLIEEADVLARLKD